MRRCGNERIKFADTVESGFFCHRLSDQQDDWLDDAGSQADLQDENFRREANARVPEPALQPYDPGPPPSRWASSHVANNLTAAPVAPLGHSEPAIRPPAAAPLYTTIGAQSDPNHHIPGPAAGPTSPGQPTSAILSGQQPLPIKVEYQGPSLDPAALKSSQVAVQAQWSGAHPSSSSAANGTPPKPRPP
jgi:hypothetical protein